MWTIERMTSDLELDSILGIGSASYINPWTREMFAWEFQNPSISYIYVLRETNGRIICYGSCWLIVEEFHINNLAIHPMWRSKGFTRNILEHTLSEAERLGAKRTMLEVRRSNNAARNLYERMGFTSAGTRNDYYKNPVEDALILWRDCLDPEEQMSAPEISDS